MVNYDMDNHVTTVINPDREEGFHGFLVGHLAQQCDIPQGDIFTLELDGEPFEARMRALAPSYDALAEYWDLADSPLTIKELARMGDMAVECYGNDDSEPLAQIDIQDQPISIRRSEVSDSGTEFVYGYVSRGDMVQDGDLEEEVAHFLAGQLGVATPEVPDVVSRVHNADFTDEDLECKRIYIPV